MRILIVDDERPARDKLRRMLELEPDIDAIEEARDGVEALEMLPRFAPDVLRATLDVGEQHQVPLELELRLLRGYASLMAERFSDRVHIAWHVDDSLLACPVPVMSMQPLLENIFKHTVERRRQGTAISISVGREQDIIVVRLEDDAGVLPAADVGACLLYTSPSPRDRG